MAEVETLRELMATVPAEFVAARNALAKRLKASGDVDQAAAIVKLRRPGVSDWALNVASAAVDTEPFVTAARDVLAAQEDAMAGRDATGLRSRLEVLRDRSAEVVAAAHAAAVDRGVTGAGSAPADLGSRLGAIAGNPAALDLLSAGLLGSAEPDAADPFGAADDTTAAVPHQRRRLTPRRAPQPTPNRREVAAAERELAGAETALAAAERKLAAATEAAAAAAAAQEAARDRRDRAAAALDAIRHGG
jgi:hypothetical protein